MFSRNKMKLTSVDNRLSVYLLKLEIENEL